MVDHQSQYEGNQYFCAKILYTGLAYKWAGNEMQIILLLLLLFRFIMPNHSQNLWRAYKISKNTIVKI